MIMELLLITVFEGKAQTAVSQCENRILSKTYVYSGVHSTLFLENITVALEPAQDFAVPRKNIFLNFYSFCFARQFII